MEPRYNFRQTMKAARLEYNVGSSSKRAKKGSKTARSVQLSPQKCTSRPDCPPPSTTSSITAPPAVPQQPFPFLALPPELRLRIYILTLVSHTSSIEIAHSNNPRYLPSTTTRTLEEITGSVEDFDEEIDCSTLILKIACSNLAHNSLETVFMPSLLLVSRLIHAEATAILYGRNTFHFCRWCHFHVFTRTCNLASLAHVRKIEICFPASAERLTEVETGGFGLRSSFNYSWARDARNVFRVWRGLQSVALVANYDLKRNCALDAEAWVKEIPEKCSVALLVKCMEAKQSTSPSGDRSARGQFFVRRPVLCERVVRLFESRGWRVEGDFVVEPESSEWVRLDRVRESLSTLTV